MTSIAICGEFLYEGDSDHPTHYCVEQYGVEHNHDDAARKPLAPNGEILNVVVLMVEGQIASHYKREWVERP